MFSIRLIKLFPWSRTTLALGWCLISAIAAGADDLLPQPVVTADSSIAAAPQLANTQLANTQSANPQLANTQSANPQSANEPSTNEPSAAQATPATPVVQVSAEDEIATLQPPADSPQGPPTAEAIEAKQEVVAEELRLAMLEEKQDAVTTASAPVTATQESRVDLLKQIDVIIAQQQSATSSREAAQARVADLSSQLARMIDGDFDAEPPHSILLLDSIKESVRSGGIKLVSSEASVVAARAAAEHSQNKAADAAKKLRQVKEAKSDPQSEEVQTADLKHKLAEEMMVLRRQELAIELDNKKAIELELEIGRAKIVIVASDVVFPKELLDEKLVELDVLEVQLNRRAERLKTEKGYAEQRWMAARHEADEGPRTPESTEHVDALKVAEMAFQDQLDLVNQRLQRLPMLKKSWNRRFAVVNKQASRIERREWSTETASQLLQLTKDRRARELKNEELRAGLSEIDSQLESIPADAEVLRRWLRVKRTTLAKQSEVLSESITTLDNATRTLDRLKVEIDGEPGRTPAEWMADAWSSTKRIWHFELAQFDDTSMTVGKVCSVVMMLFFGYFLARGMSNLLGRRLPKLGVDEAASNAIESLSFYVLLLTFGLTAMRYANVPLTVFTFFGGAIAIGVGFGSQNILNNFISGLILLAERPIKVGDMIQLDDHYGNVTKIGARSTHVRTGDNREIIVPNSKFLENEVTNLTRRDDRLRTSITIGVAYGSDLEKVMELLNMAPAGVSGVLDRTKPMVWFNDFGDNSLVFQLHFWVSAKNLTQLRMTETGVRLKIDKLFRESGISIAFPQRDIHLQTSAPIELRMVAEDADQISGASTSSKSRAA